MAANECKKFKLKMKQFEGIGKLASESQTNRFLLNEINWKVQTWEISPS